jgi:hypothetical protein
MPSRFWGVLVVYEGLSDEDAIEHTAFDLRWCAILRRPAGSTYCTKSTLQLFRAHLVLQEKLQLILCASIKEAKRCGLLKGKLAIAIDTKPIIGRGAVKDTYNLLADGIVRLARELAAEQQQTVASYLTYAGMERYTASSIKGYADIDWSDDAASQALLTQIVADANRVHPQEHLIQSARAYQQTDAGREHLRKRVVVEHSLARLAHLGIGQARYFGRAKTRFQLFIACTVANLRRTWNWVEAQSAPQPQLAAA